MSESRILQISGCDNRNRTGDVIFVHGLNGHPRKTWHPQEKSDDDNFWPAWLGEDLPNMGIWSLGYEVNSSHWKGTSMPLVHRATNILKVLDTYKIGSRPLFFITHSMGGLLVKQMLRNALDSGTPQWKAIVNQTKGIVFFSTPHDGSYMANLIQYMRLIFRNTVTIKELEAHNPRLQELTNVYRNHEILSQIPMQVYYENLPTSGILVVGENSANPGIKGVIPIPLDEDHISICKLKNRESFVYIGVKSFIEDNLKVPLPKLPPKEEKGVEKIPNQDIVRIIEGDYIKKTLDQKYNGDLVSVELDFFRDAQTEINQSEAIGIVLGISFGEYDQEIIYDNNQKGSIIFGIKRGKLRFNLQNGVMPISERKFIKTQKEDWIINSTGSPETPCWEFKANQENSKVLNGTLKDEILGYIKNISGDRYALCATFEIKINKNYIQIIKITDKEGVRDARTPSRVKETNRVKETKIMAFFRNVLEPKLKDYLSKVELIYEKPSNS
ncbi:triacylglycerol lipase [Okeania sp. SIO3I5]|uniref:esterase/lipase family protein n=1 Tax=Okeania sp. SIO3I5 TaxID=2607805 RepID=UPI0025F0A922|nr:hypothetical protein [Okeania sp. SIO3I5]